jgi:RNA polymerase sigma factor (sigma-70 family)
LMFFALARQAPFPSIAGGVRYVKEGGLSMLHAQIIPDALKGYHVHPLQAEGTGNPQPVSGLQQFRRDIASHFVRLSEQEEAALVERARLGDPDARQRLLLSLQRQVFLLAHRYADHDAQRYLDLIQEANLAILEALGSVLAKPGNICPVLVRVAQNAMVDWVTGKNDLIKRQWRDLRMDCASLDRPIDDEGKLFHEVLAGPDLRLEQQEAPDHARLYEALKQLPPLQRAVIERHFGLSGPPESLRSIALEYESPSVSTFNGKRNAIWLAKQHALTTLRRLLGNPPPTSQPEPAGAPAQQRTRRRITSFPTLSSEQLQRLEQAAALLRAQGQPVNARTLSKAAHMTISAVQTYLKREEQTEISVRCTA